MATKTESFKRTKVHTVYKTADGKRCPGVTTIIGILNKPALLDWAWKQGLNGDDYKAVRDKSADAGTLAHAMVHHHLGGPEPDFSAFTPDDRDKAENAVLSFYNWVDAQKSFEPLMLEEALVSEEMRYGGTIDCYALLNDKLTLLDFKTSKAIYDEHRIQVAAYSWLLKENGYDVEETHILRIGRTEDEGFEDHIISTEKINCALNLFGYCREIYELQKELRKL